MTISINVFILKLYEMEIVLQNESKGIQNNYLNHLHGTVWNIIVII